MIIIIIIIIIIINSIKKLETIGGTQASAHHSGFSGIRDTG